MRFKLSKHIICASAHHVQHWGMPRLCLINPNTHAGRINEALDHLIDSVRPNDWLEVNCTGFGCTIKGYFVIIPEFYRVFLWEVLHAAVNIKNHFRMTNNFLNMSVAINYHILIIQDMITSTCIVINKCF